MKQNRSKGSYSALPHNMTSSHAWRSLRASSIKVYIELVSRYKGHNNGDLHLSYGVASKLLYLGKATIKSAFDDLQEKGFIVQIEPGNWYERKASTWRLTHQRDNRSNGGLSTNDWIRWSNAASRKPESDHNSVPEPNQKGSVSEPEGFQNRTKQVGMGTVVVPINGKIEGFIGSISEPL